MNLPLILTLLALIAYVTGFLYLLNRFVHKTLTNPFLLRCSLLTGLILHALVLSVDMLTPWGINYDVFNLISFTSGLMLLLSIIFSLYRPVMILSLIATPIASLGMVIGASFSAPTQVIIEQGLGIDIHIVLSLAAYAVLLMATIHACLIWFQNRELKKKLKHRVWVNLLPSLQTMESLLFDLILVGFLLLSAALVFGFFTIDSFFGQHLAHKTVFSLFSWLIYGGLLLGHWLYGWRGSKTIRVALIAFVLLALGFIGSKFVLEIILARP
jgi:ABC-type uncharacterized transport system permease subunit